MSSVRIAAASADGVVIDLSLEEASKLWVYDVSLAGARFIELRTLAESGAMLGTAVESKEPAPPSGLTVEAVLDTIADCSLLLVRSLGFDAGGGKMQLGEVTVYEAPMRVEKAMQRFSRSPLVRRILG